MYVTSAEGYKNADVHFLKVRKTGEISASTEDSGSGMGVKNISDLTLKEIYTYVKQKALQKSKLTNAK